MEKILNFFRSKNKKNILLSLVFAFSIFLSVGVAALPTKKAKAEIQGTIYDYEWANYLDFSVIESVSVDLNAYYTVDFSGSSVILTCKSVPESGVGTGTPTITLFSRLSSTSLSSTLVPNLLTDDPYSFHCLYESSIDNLDNRLSLKFQLKYRTTGGQWKNVLNCLNFDYGISSVPVNNSGFLAALDITIVSPTDLEVGDFIEFYNFTLNAGYDCYSYTHYFYEYVNLPNEEPFIVTGPDDYLNPPDSSDDSSSDDSSSDDSSSDDSSSDNSSSDDSSSEDSSSEDSSSDDSGNDDSGGGGIIPPPDMEGDYLDGYLAGLEYGKYGVFSQCQCYIQLNYQYDYERIKITDDFFIYGGLDLSKFLPLVENKENVLSSFIFFNFLPGSRPVSSELSFSATGITDAFIGNPWSVTFQNTVGSRQLSWSLVSSETLTTDRNIYKSDTLSQSFTGSDVILSFKTPTFSTFDYLSGLTITVSNNLYELGYSAGLTVNGQDRYDAGYSSGLIVGEDIGFKKGLNQGLSGDPYGAVEFMYSFLDMPGRILSNWLNFEFLGVNLLGLVTFLLSITLFVFVLKKAV